MTAPEKPRRNFYGRRSGHKLHKGRQRLVDEVLPSLRVSLPQTGFVDTAALFSPPKKQLWLEIGFGGGEHLAWQAERNPDVGMIGCEPFLNGVASLLGHLQTNKASNVRIFDDDARDLLDALPDACLDRLFILFADPWPKKRHNKRRIVNSETVEAYARLLKEGAELRFASDHMGYVAWTLELLTNDPRFHWTARKADDWRVRPDDWPQTRYEIKSLAGDRSAYLTFVRTAAQ